MLCPARDENGRMCVSRAGVASAEVVTGVSPPAMGTANDESQFRGMGVSAHGFGTACRHRGAAPGRRAANDRFRW